MISLESTIKFLVPFGVLIQSPFPCSMTVNVCRIADAFYIFNVLTNKLGPCSRCKFEFRFSHMIMKKMVIRLEAKTRYDIVIREMSHDRVSTSDWTGRSFWAAIGPKELPVPKAQFSYTFFIIRGQSKNSESWAVRLLIHWLFLLFYTDNMHKW